MASLVRRDGDRVEDQCDRNVHVGAQERCDIIRVPYGDHRSHFMNADLDATVLERPTVRQPRASIAAALIKPGGSS